MRVAITGASGLVGTAVCRALEARGDETVVLVRGQVSDPARQIAWDPAAGRLTASELSGIDAVVHLAGENVAGGRWTAARKQRIRDSRVAGTKLIAEAMATCPDGPKVLVAASAIGYYGDRGAEVVKEEDPSGSGFLAEVCRDWEAATSAAAGAGIRVANLRIGLVLSPEGGALARMLPAFRLGLGGVPGDASVYLSWVSLDDLVGIVLHVLDRPDLSGPVNAFAPAPVTSGEFTRTLGRVLRRPAFFHVPAAALRLGLGEMADGMLFMSVRGVPQRLIDSGYAFRHPKLEGALRALLGA
jgi:uncharacterized protein (TIGR01777 family)